MNAIIVDDERLARLELKKLLKDYPEINVVDEAANANEAIEKIKEHNPGLIFLDIQMPGKTGFEMLIELDFVPKIIFTTAFDEFALRAFDANALDYLLKPIAPKRLADAINKLQTSESAATRLETENGGSQLYSLSEQDQVFVKDGDKYWFVKISEIRILESVGNYAKVYFGNNKPLILKTLNALEERLDKRMFFRASRKHIINLRWVDKMEPYFNGGLLIELRGGEKVEVSRRQATKFKEIMSL